MLASFGTHTGFTPPPNCEEVASSTRPGEVRYFDPAAKRKFVSLELAWRTFFQDRLPSSLPVNVDDTQILRARPLDLPSPEMTAEEIVARCPAIPLDDRTLPPGCKWLGNSIVGGPAGLNPSVAVAAPIDPVILHTSYRSETRTVADTSVTVPRPGLAQAGDSAVEQVEHLD